MRNLTIAFLPIATFFIAHAFFGFFVGIGAMIIITALGVLVSVLFDRTFPWFALFSLTVAASFGGASILLQNPDIFIFSDTASNLFIAAALIMTLLNGRPLLKIFFEHSFAISDRAWRILTYRWAVLFIILAVGNEFVRFFYSEDVWVWYRAFSTVLTIIFGMYQFTLSRKERIVGESNAWGLRTAPQAPATEALR